MQITSVSPTALSVRGGTLINFTGSGFSNIGPENHVELGNLSCSVVSSTFTTLSCIAPPASLSSLDTLCWGGQGCANSTTSTASPGTIHQVSWGFDISNASIIIAPGDTVQWNWDQSPAGYHNLVSGTRESPTAQFSCPYATSGSCTHTFAAAGTYSVHCTPHTAMNAVITVASRRVRRNLPRIDAPVSIRVFNFESGENETADGAWGNWIGGVYDGYNTDIDNVALETRRLDGAWSGWATEISTILRETKYYGYVSDFC